MIRLYKLTYSDIIHVKDLLLAQYGTLMERLAVILRPGGLLVLVEEEPRFVSQLGVLFGLELTLIRSTLSGRAVELRSSGMPA